MCVLALNNNFWGSYQSNQVYFVELVDTMRKLVKKVYTANDVFEAQKIIEHNHVDFSISFGKYFYNVNDIPLYEKYNLLHYQWVSDNPLKMNIDHQSKNIRYIFIDEEFYEIAKPLKIQPLVIPLGYPNCEKNDVTEKIDAVLMPTKIRNIKKICDVINSEAERELLWGFIESYQINTSFIHAFMKFLDRYSVSSPEHFFRITNEYFRVKKRLEVVNSIEAKHIHILGKDYGNDFKHKQNITYIKPLNFTQTLKMMSAYRYVINVDPNYYFSVHDRFIRTIVNNSVCLTNINGIWSKEQKFSYDFLNMNAINDEILNIDKCYYEILSSEKQAVRYFSWSNAVLSIIDNFIFDKEVNAYEILR